MRRSFPRVLTLAAALLVAGAATGHAQKAHVHGLAWADVAVDGALIEISLRATAYDLVGFERAPRDADERAKVEGARALMLDHARLWHFNSAAGCVADAPVLEAPAEPAEASADSGSSHVDWQVRYRFTCANPQALMAIDAELFSALPSLETLQVQLLDGVGARGVELSPGSRRIDLSQ